MFGRATIWLGIGPHSSFVMEITITWSHGLSYCCRCIAFAKRDNKHTSWLMLGRLSWAPLTTSTSVIAVATSADADVNMSPRARLRTSAVTATEACTPTVAPWLWSLGPRVKFSRFCTTVA